MTDMTQAKITRDQEPTTPEQARPEVRENEQGVSGARTPPSASESPAQPSSPGRKPLFRR